MAPVSNRLRGWSSRKQGMVCWASFVMIRSPSCGARGGHMPDPAKYLGDVYLSVGARGSLVLEYKCNLEREVNRESASYVFSGEARLGRMIDPGELMCLILKAWQLCETSGQNVTQHDLIGGAKLDQALRLPKPNVEAMNKKSIKFLAYPRCESIGEPWTFNAMFHGPVQHVTRRLVASSIGTSLTNSVPSSVLVIWIGWTLREISSFSNDLKCGLTISTHPTG